MLVTSRSLAEYEAMFDLDARALGARILDCCAGAASFVAELAARGGRGVAVDPAYALPRAELKSAATRALGDVDQIVDRHADRFTLKWYGSAERKRAIRRGAAARFLEHLDSRPACYVAGSLPHLPFADRSHDIVLCSHLLFTWSNVFDADWHLAAVYEMLRVARADVRIFPLVVQGTGDDVPFLDGLMERLRDAGHAAEIRRVPYMYQRGADAMMVVRPGG